MAGHYAIGGGKCKPLISGHYILYPLTIFSTKSKLKNNCVAFLCIQRFCREAIQRLIYCSTTLMWVTYNPFVAISQVKIWE
jgi:hypothetical protein